MDSPAVLVRLARETAALRPEQLAAWARLDLGRLNDLEEGRASFTWRELDGCARVFGLRVDDLLDGEAGRAPMTLLLRSDQSESSLGCKTTSPSIPASCWESFSERYETSRISSDSSGTRGRTSP